MKPILNSFLYVFRFHKMKIVFTLGAAILFLFILFPFDDLGDLVSSKVAELTQNQVFLQFDHLGFSLLPQPGIELEKVYLETPMTPALQVGTLKASPSILGLLSFKPGISLQANKIFRGDLSLVTKGLGKSKSGGMQQNIDISGENLDVSEITGLIKSPVQPKGKLSLTANSDLDLLFNDQPSGQVKMNIKNFNLSSASIPTVMGPLNLPDLNLKSVDIEGELKNGKLTVSKAVMGDPSEEFYLNGSGDMEFKIQRTGQVIAPNFGGYNFEVHMSIKKSFADKASLFLSFVDAYKTSTTAAGSTYALRLSAPNFYIPPKMTRIN